MKNQFSPLRNSNLPTVAMTVLAVGLLSTSVLMRSAVAKDAAPAAPATGKVATEQLPKIRGVVAAIEGDTLTVGTTEDHKKVQKKLTLAQGVAISLTPDKKHETHLGQRADIVPGIGVVLTLSADGTTVKAIQVMGRTVHGSIAAVDASSITITSKTKDGPKEEKFTLTPATVIVLSHGKEKGSVQTGTVMDLKVNMPVAVTLSAVEKTTAKEVAVQPATPNPKTGK
jgi:hypothetical protein